MDTESMELRTRMVGSLPVINHFLRRLDLDGILSRRLPSPQVAQCITLLARNILVSREPLYAMGEWVNEFPAELLGIGGLEGISDDRIGRSLEGLFDADRSSLLTEIVVHAVREFDLSMERFHNDSTSVALSGIYRRADGRDIRSKRTVNLTFGHSKDHRSDLKQLVWILTATSDGAVPVHYRIADGNTSDAPTHMETWDSIRRLTGRSDFLYIADSKLCTGENMQYIHGNQGRFITVLPATRKEHGLFREWLQDHPDQWTGKMHGKGGERGQVWKLMESPIPASDGFRIIWVWSSQKARHDREIRHGIMNRSIMNLERLETRLRSPKCRLRTSGEVEKAASDAVGNGARWVGFTISEESTEHRKQAHSGRPSPSTEYRIVVRKRFHVEWRPNEENIDFDEACDGIFPLITNDANMSPKAVLSMYKYQPHVEKRHEQLKSVYGVAPVMLKNIDRIEALLFVYFIALLLESLIEREIRNNMKKENRKSIHIYPESRPCESPTTDRVLGDFYMVQMHWIESGGETIRKFLPNLTMRQEELLRLAGVPVSEYQKDWNVAPGR